MIAASRIPDPVAESQFKVYTAASGVGFGTTGGMIHQVVAKLPEGPVCVDDRRCTFPDKKLVYREIESLINHFKLVMDGPQVPAGEVYVAHEAPNGELGFYLVSTGEGVPHKVHVRAPSFVHMGALHRLLEGYQLADIIPTFGSVNMIGGECDR